MEEQTSLEFGVEEDVITWEDAIVSDEYINFEPGIRKKLDITNWRIVKTVKFDKEQVEFRSDITMEDGEVVDKKIGKTSRRLISVLKPILEDQNPKSIVTISVKQIGEGYKVVYDAELVE